MKSSKAVTSADPAVVAGLERILREQLQGHRRLLESIERTREAVRKADMAAIETHCRQEHEIASALAELEKGRLALVGRLTERLRPGAATPLTISEIAECAGDDAGPRLEAVAAELKSQVIAVRRESSVVRTAAEALSRHMSGLMQTVQAVLCRAQVYSRRGRIASGMQKQFCIDVTT